MKSESNAGADLARLKIDKSAPTSNSLGPNRPRRQMWAAAALLLVGIAAAYVLVSGQSEAPDETRDKPQVEANSPPMAISRTSVLNATAYVVAQRQAAVASKATGRLRELNVVEGDKVKQGQVIGILENEDLSAQVAEREAGVNAARAVILANEAEVVEADAAYQRARDLRQQGVISQSELDQATARHKRSNSDLAAARANLRLAEAQLERAKVDLGYTYIVAPFDGTVLTKNADVGEIVAPLGSSADARAAVVTLADMSSLEVEADVSEANITKVFPGQECEITLDSFPGRTYRGIVSKIVPTVDRAKATVLTKIKFLDLDDHVLPEMSAKVAFKLQVS